MNRNKQLAHRLIQAALVGLAILCGLASAQPIVMGADPADLVLRDGVVVTMDRNRPRAESVACRGGEIVAVGTVGEMDKLIGETTRVVELNGRMLSPGFIEGHGHFVALGSSKLILDLSTVQSWSEVVAMVKKAASKAGSGRWIMGRGWHQAKLTSLEWHSAWPSAHGGA